jgi:hypothetical protein
VPVTLFCVLSLLYVLVKDKQTGMKTVGWAVSLTSSFVAVIITVLALGAVMDSLIQTGRIDPGQGLWGYPVYLALINLAAAGGLLFLILNRQKYLERV